MPYKPAKAILFGLFIWIVGFIWGSFVFMTPALKQTRPIPYVSSNPAISFPILVVWLLLTFTIARKYLRLAPDKASEGLKLGVVLAVINLLLDLVVLVSLLKAGFGYFASLTVWVAYTMLIVVPWLVGRSSVEQTGR